MTVELQKTGRGFSANENAMRNQVKLYYKKGSIKPNEAIVDKVYKELDPVDTEYCKKQLLKIFIMTMLNNSDKKSNSVSYIRT